MGYTHYWYQAKELDKQTFFKAAYDCRTVCGTLRIPLADADGLGFPNFDAEYIALNGHGEDAYEAFIVDRVFSGTEDAYFQPGEVGRCFDFCKTAHRPYDLAVQCCLIVLAHYFPAFKVTSDGEQADWARAMEACQAALGFGQNFKLGE